METVYEIQNDIHRYPLRCINNKPVSFLAVTLKSGQTNNGKYLPNQHKLDGLFGSRTGLILSYTVLFAFRVYSSQIQSAYTIDIYSK